MVGAIKDAHQNLFSPPPLFALSPRMIVTDEDKRMSMKHVLIGYLDGKACEAERELLQDLEREDKKSSSGGGGGNKDGVKNATTVGTSDGSGNTNAAGDGGSGGTNKTGKNAKKKKAKKKKKQLAAAAAAEAEATVAKQCQQQQHQDEINQGQSSSQPQQELLQPPTSSTTTTAASGAAQSTSASSSNNTQPKTIQQAHHKEASNQNPLNKEQLAYLREHQQKMLLQKQKQQQQDESDTDANNGTNTSKGGIGIQKPQYSEEDRKIIEDALERNGLSSSAALSPNCAERIYKESKKNNNNAVAAAANGKTTNGGVSSSSSSSSSSGAGTTKNDDCKPTPSSSTTSSSSTTDKLSTSTAKSTSAKDGEVNQSTLKYEEEVQNYAYAWCCDYCKLATFPTFAEAALHESKCTVFLELRQQQEKVGLKGDGKDIDKEGDAENVQTTNVDDEKKVEEVVGAVDDDTGQVEQNDDQLEESSNNKSSDQWPTCGGENDENKTDNCQEELTSAVEIRGDVDGQLVADLNSVDKDIGTTSEQAIDVKAMGGPQHVSSSDVKYESDRSQDQITGDNIKGATSKKREAGVKAAPSPSVVSTESSSSVANDTIDIEEQHVSSPPPPPPPSTHYINDRIEATSVIDAAEGEGDEWRSVQRSKKKTSPKPTKKKKGKGNNKAAPSAIADEIDTATAAKSEKPATLKTKAAKKKQKNGAKGKKKIHNNDHNLENEQSSNGRQKEQSSLGAVSYEGILTTPEPTNNGNVHDAAKVSDHDLARIMKPLAIDYDDRVNDTALHQLQPTDNVEFQSSFALPPLVLEPAESLAATSSMPNQSTAIDANISSQSINEGMMNARVASLTSENEIMAARNNFLDHQNKALLAENEALRNQLVSYKQQSVEAVQRVQLKAYISETARDVAEERVAWLENVLANSVADMTAKEVARREVKDAVGIASVVIASSQQQQHHQQHHQRVSSQPLPHLPQSMSPMPQAMPGGYHLQQQQHQPHLQRQSSSEPPPFIPHNAQLLPSNTGPHPPSVSTNIGLIGHPPQSSSPFHNSSQDNHLHHQHQGSLGNTTNSSSPFMDPLDSAVNNARGENDFWEPPWMMTDPNLSVSGGGSVLSRLRRGDHA